MTQRYLMDTYVISHIMQGRDVKLLAKLSKLPIGQAAISSVTLAEIEYGIQRRGSPTKLRNALTQVMLHMDVLPWDAAAAICYGELCSSLETQGISLSDFDMMIAAHAVALKITLVSRDKAFAHIPKQRLKLEVW
ncbi:MAG: type II toxin-antitoxin system VapC family toxin [Burkholderiaceae bacterium]|nr:type II toxin-antitoxin system VapC family toxin [Burkholderiaceae bacterium]